MHSYFIDIKIRRTKYFVNVLILDLPNSAAKKFPGIIIITKKEIFCISVVTVMCRIFSSFRNTHQIRRPMCNR